MLSLENLAVSRSVQSAHDEMMRSGELKFETSEVTEVFCPGGIVTSCSMSDMLDEDVLDLRTDWSLNESVGRVKQWTTREERQSKDLFDS